MSTVAERRVQIIRDWNANKLTWKDALRLLHQEGGLPVEKAARVLAGDEKL